MSTRNSNPNLFLKITLPILTIIAAILIYLVFVKLSPEVEKKELVHNYPRIDVYTVHEESVRIKIDAQGSVQPRQQTRLTARVSGHIEWVSPDFYEGGNFSEGDVLLRLDPLPYQSALAESKSRLALAESVLLQEQEASKQAKTDWESVGMGQPSQLVLRIPQLKKAEADLEAAEIALRMAEDNLSYAEIKAPYTGRISSKMVDVGQAISARATILGDIFSMESMEIPLAITLDDLSLIYHDASHDKARVTLTSKVNGTTHTWNAYLDRTASTVNPRTRMINAYARLDPPFKSDQGMELTPGMFVNASIQGKSLDKAFRIPRGAIQPGNVAYRVKDENRLESVSIEILRTDSEWAITTNGLVPGDQLCLTPLLFFTEGMQIELGDNPSASSSTSTDPEL